MDLKTTFLTMITAIILTHSLVNPHTCIAIKPKGIVRFSHGPNEVPRKARYFFPFYLICPCFVFHLLKVLNIIYHYPMDIFSSSLFTAISRALTI